MMELHPGPSRHIIGVAARDQELTPRDLQVLVYLHDVLEYVEPRRIIASDVARHLRTNDRTIRESMEKLTKHGYVVRCKRDGPYFTYRLLLHRKKV